MTDHNKTTRPKKGGFSRRTFVKGAAAGAAVLGFPAIVRSQSDRRIVIRDPGGPFTPGFAAAYYEPFTKDTGITAVGVQGPHEPTGMIRAMVEAKNYTWDMALLSVSAHASLLPGGFLVPVHGPGGPGPNMSQIPENMRGEFISGNDVYATVMAYRTDTRLGQNPPRNWAEFWDLDGFPGVRSMRRHAFDTLEFALMADGVTPADLYPLDLDRAFAKLDEIKPHIDIWWTGGAQTSQLLHSGEVDALYTWNGRAQVAIDDGAPVVINWNQGMWTFEGWSILAGGPNVDLCREFIEWTAQPEAQARYTPHVAYGPTNPNAFAHVDPERAKDLPTNPDFFDSLVEANVEYWGEHKDAVDERFNTWLLS